MKKEKYYKCPQCGSRVTHSKILKECSNGGLGMCYCEFSYGGILIPYKKISKKEYLKEHSSN